ncbi:hypothetical protein AVEN_109-1 [Araneus ventricosus]|uniref:Uncharacterized protein n=1 Tax=Araneus ventricosus TaxID=182803 RepID=A0A4Y2D3P3_ARAVE|nr:hypothetical protein AVEN_109-1 [Araneus ventricosus]
MIHWNTTTLSPPPLLRRFTNQEIWSMVQSGGTAAEWNFDRFPCHTQAVERCVKLVTEASHKDVGSNSRVSFIRTILLSKSSTPNFSRKSHFKVPKETEGKFGTIFDYKLKFNTMRNNFLFQRKFVNFL